MRIISSNGFPGRTFHPHHISSEKTLWKLRETSQSFLDNAGIRINGMNSWDIQVYNDKFYQRVLSQGTLGLGESYMDSWWDCEKLDEFFHRVMEAGLEETVEGKGILFNVLKARLINLQSRPGLSRLVNSTMI